jgi:hypothetical protein
MKENPIHFTFNRVDDYDHSAKGPIMSIHREPTGVVFRGHNCIIVGGPDVLSIRQREDGVVVVSLHNATITPLPEGASATGLPLRDIP